MVEGVLTWLAAQSGVSGRRASSLQNTDKDKLNFPIHSHNSHFPQPVQRARLLSPLTLDNSSFKHTHRSEDISLIKYAQQLLSQRNLFPINLIIFVLCFKGPGIGFPTRGTWPIMAWKWPNCVWTLFVSPLSFARGWVLLFHCASMCGTLWSRSMRSSRGAHLALFGCNEHEQAVGPGVGEDQEISVCIFPLTASGPRWNQT